MNKRQAKKRDNKKVIVVYVTTSEESVYGLKVVRIFKSIDNFSDTNGNIIDNNDITKWVVTSMTEKEVRSYSKEELLKHMRSIEYDLIVHSAEKGMS